MGLSNASDASNVSEAYQRHIVDSVARAKACQSKCVIGVLKMEGMSGAMTRHLYNNLCALRKPDGSVTRYLEVGAWKGSSTVSALYNNLPLCRATIVDNWSEFGGPRTEFERNMALFLGWPDAVPPESVQVLNDSCWDLVSRPPGRVTNAPFDIYLYDGEHTAQAHEHALTHMWSLMADVFIFVVDDWNWTNAKVGTQAALTKLVGAGAARVVHHEDIAGPEGADGFWNGTGIFLIQKLKVEQQQQQQQQPHQKQPHQQQPHHQHPLSNNNC